MPLSVSRQTCSRGVGGVGWDPLLPQGKWESVIDDWAVVHQLGLWEGFGDSLEPLMGGDR